MENLRAAFLLLSSFEHVKDADVPNSQITSTYGATKRHGVIGAGVQECCWLLAAGCTLACLAATWRPTTAGPFNHTPGCRP